MPRFLVLVLLLWPVFAWAQVDADSMSVEATLARLPAKERLVFLKDEVRRTIFNDPKLAISIADRWRKLAIEQNNPLAINNALMSIGRAHYLLGEYQDALRRYQEGMVVANEIGDKVSIADALNNIGVLYYVWGEHDLALEYYLRTLALRLEMNDQKGVGNCYNNIAGLHNTAGRYSSALEYYQKALTIYHDLNEFAFEAGTMNNLGLLKFDQGKYDEAMAYLREALALEREIKDKLGESLSLNNMGMVLTKQGRLDEARALYDEALAIRRQIHDRQGESVTLQLLGTVMVNDGDIEGGIVLLQEALSIARELEVQELIRDDLLALADAWELAGQFENALGTFRQFKEAHDQLFDEERTRQMASAEARYETDLKDKEIASLLQQAQYEKFRRRIMLFGAFFLLLILGLLWNRYRFQKRAHSEIQIKNQSLALAHSELEKGAREQLAHVARVATMGELTAAFAHELHQPLTAIKTNARAGRNLLQRSAIDEVEETLVDISEDAERAREIISRLRDMMRKGEERREHHNINEVIQSGMSFVDKAYQKQDVSIRFDLASGLPNVNCDRIQLQQVLLNLVQNSLAAMEDCTGEVVVRTALVEDDQVVVRIQDSGPEISNEILSEMFDPFFTTKSAGLGMGLPICRTIIEAHGGKLLATRNPGGGLTMMFQLPGIFGKK